MGSRLEPLGPDGGRGNAPRPAGPIPRPRSGRVREAWGPRGCGWEDAMSAMDYETLTEAEWERVQGVWQLLDEGRLEDARAELAGLLSSRPGHPDLRIVD